MRFVHWLRSKWYWLIFLVLCVGAYAYEESAAWRFYSKIVPFPEVEYWLRIADNFLRDFILVFFAWILYLRRSRIPDRVRRYFPVVVIGLGYLCFAYYMIVRLQLDLGFMTVLAVFAGLNNNILLVLLAAMLYHRQPNVWWRRLYFAVYLLQAFLLLVDAIYFWQTSMHVQSVFFRNLNIYAAQGVLSSFSGTQFVAGVVIMVAVVLLFRVNKPTRHKPNFVWSLLCVAAFSMVLNLLYVSGKQASLSLLKESGLWSEQQIEKSRQEYRDLVITPVAPEIALHAVFSKDKASRTAAVLQKRDLTDRDRQLMQQLGVIRTEKAIPLGAPAYDRVVLLVLESVHRDYIHGYNPVIPQEATPFLDSLLQKYPHLDRYYSSAIPTTEGLNATFRSLLLFDNDLDGPSQPSLYRSVQAAGWKGIFLSASSKYYNNEFKMYTNQFGMEEYMARENLEAKGYSGASGWGFHNDVMYAETVKILEEHKGQRYLLTTKTLDMHQPYPYYATPWEETPPSFRDNQLVTIHGMYWVDSTLKKFFDEVQAKGLMDDRTLFIITSDHNPHSGGEYTQIVQKPEDRQSIAPIPLIFVAKNLQPLLNLQQAAYASQIDLTPTLLCLLGIQPSERFLGRNLLQDYSEPANALGFFGDKAYYFSDDLCFVDKIDEPYPEHDYEDSLANFVMYSYYRSSVKEGAEVQ